MEKFKILHLISTNKFTAIENTIVQSIELFKNDYKIAYASPNGSISKVLRNKEINYLPMENWDLKSISNIIETYSPNLVHAHGLEACILANKFSKKVQIVAHMHENLESMQKLSKNSFRFNLSSKNFKKIIWPSEESLNSYKYSQNILKKSIIIKKAVNCESVVKKSTSTENNTKNIFDILLFADNLTDDDFSKFTNILAIIKERGFSFKCGIISSLSQTKKHLSYIKENGLEDSIFFINELDNYYYLLAKAKFLFIVENHEETPIYALEANALGVPVLAPICNGLKPIIQNEFNGFLANNEFDLANFAARMLDDRHLWLSLSTNALTHSDKQNEFDLYVENLKNIYQKE